MPNVPTAARISANQRPTPVDGRQWLCPKGKSQNTQHDMRSCKTPNAQDQRAFTRVTVLKSQSANLDFPMGPWLPPPRIG